MITLLEDNISLNNVSKSVSQILYRYDNPLSIADDW